MMTPDEISAFIANALGRNIQDEIEGIVVLNSDGTNPAEDFLYTIPVQIQEQPETLYARYDPLADATEFADGSPVLLKYNKDGELEARFDPRRGRMAYGGVIPTRNMLFFQHTHQSDSTGGQLNAGLIFDAGQVVLERGGTEADLSALTTGALIAKDASTLGAANLTANSVVLGNGTGAPLLVAPGTSGNVLTSNGTTWQSTAPSGSSPWTTTSNVIHPGVLTDSISIGTATANGKLYVLGDDGTEMTARIRAASGQSVSVFSVEDNSGNSLFDVTVNGSVTTNADALPNGDFTVIGSAGGTLFTANVTSNQVQIEGGLIFNDAGANADARFEGDTDQNLLFLDASTDSVQIGGSAPTDWLHLKAATTARAPLRLPGGTAPTSPNDGAIWNSTAQQAFFGVVAGMTGSFGRPLFTQTAVTGNNNVTSQISLLGTGVGSRTLAANFWTVGKSILVLAAGYHQTDGAKNTTWRFKAGSVELASSTSASYSAGGSGGRLWWSFFILTCYSTGASGDFWCQGRVMCHNDTNFNMWNTAVVNLNTTASMAIDETFQTTTTSALTLAFGTNALIFEMN